MATLSLHLGPSARGSIGRLISLFGRGSVGSVFRRALALYLRRIGSMNLDQLKMEAQEIKAHRKTDR